MIQYSSLFSVINDDLIMCNTNRVSLNNLVEIVRQNNNLVARNTFFDSENVHKRAGPGGKLLPPGFLSFFCNLQCSAIFTFVLYTAYIYCTV